MSNSVIVEVRVYDDTTKEVVKHVIDVYEGSYGWEVEAWFTSMGERFAPIIDPYHGRPD